MEEMRFSRNQRHLQRHLQLCSGLGCCALVCVAVRGTDIIYLAIKSEIETGKLTNVS